MELKPPFRRATADDAEDMAELVNIAGYGLALQLWQRLAKPGQSAREVGLERARRGAGGFAYGNTVVREHEGKVAACLTGHPYSDEPWPDDVPSLVVPLLELEALAPDTWYINVLATFEQYRGHGFGSELMRLADKIALEAGCSGQSLIASDSNEDAIRLYERLGFEHRASRPIVKDGWEYEGENWILMVKYF